MRLGAFEPPCLQITAGNVQVVCQEAGEEAWIFGRATVADELLIGLRYWTSIPGMMVLKDFFKVLISYL